MRLVVALLVGVVLFSAGCDGPVVKNEYMSMDDLTKTKKFLTYEIVIGPGLVEPYDPKAEEDDRTCNTGLTDMEGPFRVTKDVNADVRIETRNPFHRRVMVDGKYHEFKLTEDVIGFGYRFVSVRNKKDEMGIIVLKTKGKAQSWDVNASDGVLLTESEQKEKEKREKRVKEEREKRKLGSDDGSGDKDAEDKDAEDKDAEDKDAEDKDAEDKDAEDKDAEDKADEDKDAEEESDGDKSSDK